MAVAVPSAPVAEISTGYSPAMVGTPEIRPVSGPMPRPSGSPPAANDTGDPVAEMT